MNRIQRFKFLQVFGDGKAHNWFEVIFLGVQFLKLHQTVFEKDIFKKALEAGLIRRVENDEVKLVLAKMVEHKSGIFVGPDWTRYDYIITPLGDTCLREEQIARDGDVSYYKYFDRSLTGENGLNRYAPIPKRYTKAD